MTRGELTNFFPSKWNTPTNLGAVSYAVPTLRWLQGEFWEFFRARLWDANLHKWKVRWQCRDFARAYAGAAQECWAATNGGNDDGIAVGEMWFLPDQRLQVDVGHAICPAITDVGRVFIDPQNNQQWNVSPTEFESRYHLRF